MKTSLFVTYPFVHMLTQKGFEVKKVPHSVVMKSVGEHLKAVPDGHRIEIRFVKEQCQPSTKSAT